MNKHTPGPWFVEYGGKLEPDRVYCIYAVQKHPDNSRPDGFRDITIVDTDGGFYPPDPADAHLIAAAPELLQVLQEIVRKDLLAGAIKHDARAAIAKATGGGE